MRRIPGITVLVNGSTTLLIHFESKSNINYKQADVKKMNSSLCLFN